MSRSGYSYDCDNLGLWRHAVDLAIRGKKGKALLQEMATALDEMLVKELHSEVVVRNNEHVCALGSVAVARGLDVSQLDVYDRESVAKTFGIAPALAAEIAWENDENGPSRGETPAERWQRMRAWVEKQLALPAPIVHPKKKPSTVDG